MLVRVPLLVVRVKVVVVRVWRLCRYAPGIQPPRSIMAVLHTLLTCRGHECMDAAQEVGPVLQDTAWAGHSSSVDDYARHVLARSEPRWRILFALGAA